MGYYNRGIAGSDTARRDKGDLEGAKGDHAEATRLGLQQPK
jgi:hypothetical protein